MKYVVGLGLVVTGGAMVMASATAGFMFGVTIMMYANAEDEKDSAKEEKPS